MNKAFALILCACIALAPVHAALGENSKPQVWRSGDETVNRIAITIDDCYRKTHVTEVLDLCDEYDIHVTFFPVGNTILPEDGELWRRIVESGHEIGNHTYGHTSMTDGVDNQQCRSRFVKMEMALDTALGYHYEIQLFRPPYGRPGYAAHWRRFAKNGYSNIILWSIDSTDVNWCIKQVKNGSILLFHANDKDVECLRELIPAVLDMGYEPVTVSELLKLEPIVKQREANELVVFEEQSAAE